jgi:Oxidoreductase family, NAD-binding Rossmann fold
MRRRDFLRLAGASVGAATLGGTALAGRKPPFRTPRATGKSVVGLVTPKMDVVRVGLIGLGARGSGHLDHMLALQGVEVHAICDNHAPTLQAAQKQFTDKGKVVPPSYGKDDHDYRNMLDRDDIDIVIIATPWELHVPMAVDAMNRGKHAFVEVPAAVTVEEAWQLVDTAERTQRHCMMMENVCYGREELMVLNMCRLGLFGELLHGEGSYIHDLRGQMYEIEHGTGSWRTTHYTKRNGNIYPTHGLGPVAQYLSINRGDRFDYLSSMSSPARVREIFAKEHFPADSIRRKQKFICGDINTTIVKTVKGRTVMIQWDEQLPRPYSRLNLIQGTKGVWGGFPDRVVIEGVTKTTEDWTEGADLNTFYEKYDHPLWKRVGEEAKLRGGHGGMDWVMLWRAIDCLRNGVALDQDVYDAAAWSVISPLSEWSVANRGQSVDVPDFTRGKWANSEPLGIVS